MSNVCQLCIVSRRRFIGIYKELGRTEPKNDAFEIKQTGKLRKSSVENIRNNFQFLLNTIMAYFLYTVYYAVKPNVKCLLDVVSKKQDKT